MSLSPLEKRTSRAAGLVSVALVVAMLTACTQPPSSEGIPNWLARTTTMVNRPIDVSGATDALDLPATGGTDVYSVALAISSAGRDARRDITVASQRSARALVTRSISTGSFSKTIAGPLYTAAELLRADDYLTIMSTSDRLSLRKVLSENLTKAVGETPDSIDTYILVQVAARLKYGEPKALASAQADTNSKTDLCSGTKDPFQLLFASATPGLVTGCSSSTLTQNWTMRAQQVAASLLGGGDISGGQCGEIRALAESNQLQWPHSAANSSALKNLLRAAEAKTSAERLSDPIACLSDLQTASVIVNDQSFPLTTNQISYLNLVVEGGGEPVTYSLSPDSLASLVAIDRMGGNGTAVEGILGLSSSKAPSVEELDAADAPWSDSQEFQIMAILKDNPASAEDLDAVMSAVALGGTPACVWLKSGEIKSKIQTALEQVTPDIVMQARVAYLSARCGTSLSAVSLASLNKDADSRVANLKSRGITGAWQAMTAVCAVEPSKLASQSDIWSAFQSQIGTFGGVSAGPGEISLVETSQLEAMLLASRTGCEKRGVLGYAATP